jgi:hypothetical protein
MEMSGSLPTDLGPNTRPGPTASEIRNPLYGAVGAMLPAAGDHGEEVFARFAGQPTLAHDSSTNALIRRYRMGKEAAR